MSLVLTAPGRYVQGRGVIDEIGDHLALLGERALLLGGPTALSVSQSKISASLKRKNIELVVETFGKESSLCEIDRLVQTAKKNQVDVVIGAGGGKALDTAKAVAHYLNKPVACIPTVASTDAPCSGTAGVYSDEHFYVKTIFLRSNPQLVLVDTEIIINAPVRFLVAGIGDALSTKFEAEACVKASAVNLHGGNATAASLKIAQLCFDILMEYGIQAKLCAERKVVTFSLEKVIEAVILLSGVGFESCGLSAAHALEQPLTILDELHDNKIYHGEAIALFTLVQLVLENQPLEVIHRIMKFCCYLGLPITLQDVGLDGTPKDDLMKMVKAACKEGSIMHNLPFPVDPEMVYSAIMLTEALGQEFKKRGLIQI